MLFLVLEMERNSASKLERAYFDQLKLRQKNGEVIFFLRQPTFDLVGNTTYRADFQVFLSNGEVEFVDCKGLMTPMSILKIKQVEDLYPIKIKIVKALK